MEFIQMFTIYDHPKDYPGCYIARKWLIGPGSVNATTDIIIGTDVSKIREKIKKLGFSRIPRSVNDDPVILETWMK